MKVTRGFLVLLALALAARAQTKTPDALVTADRWKADLLLVVAHPDDESEIGAYLARAVFDEHKRVAVVFGTRGNGGGDEVGAQQAASLGAIREMEGRQALGFLGVDKVWFLDAPDTAGQDVLSSLETWDHGRSLGRLVRLVRLTRPAVVATWLPDTLAGENHGDHQAAGVLATEAFDAAGDPTQFPEQVTPPRNARGIGNLTEGLRPWQAQKLYFFSDTSHPEFMNGHGPQYSASDVSQSKQETYAVLSARECAFHLTQSDSGYAAAMALAHGHLEGTYFAEPSRFILGKSYVGGEVTSDIFAGVRPEALAYHPPAAYVDADQTAGNAGPSLRLGGAWHFYPQFWRVHGIEHLEGLVPPEVLAGVNTAVSIPVLVGNPGGAAVDGALAVEVPNGWRVRDAAARFSIAAGDTFATTVVVTAPAKVDTSWQTVRVHATVGQRPVGEVSVRVAVAQFSLPQ